MRSSVHATDSRGPPANRRHARWRTMTSTLKPSGKARAITTSARTSARCCNTSKRRRRSSYWTSVAGPGAISGRSRRWAITRSASKAQRSWPRWRVHTAAATVLEQNFLELTCPSVNSTAYSPTRRCFMCPARHCPASCWNCTGRSSRAVCLFSSNPRGEGQEGWNGGRYGAFHDWETWRGFMTTAGFVELTHFYRPAGLPPEQQPWLASVWRKPLP